MADEGHEPEELEEEKKENLKSLVRDFSGVDTRNELQMLQSPELFFYNDSEFDNEDMNQDYQDAAATRSEPNLKLVGGKYVHEDIHDTLQAAKDARWPWRLPVRTGK